MNEQPADRQLEDDLLSIKGGITATLLVNDRVTPAAHWQDVRYLSFSLPEQHLYGPGDVLTIYPKNFSSDVDQILRVGGWEFMADTPLEFLPTDQALYDRNAATYPSRPIPTLHKTTLTLRQLFTNHLDIMSIPRRSFFAHLVHYTTDQFHIDRLKEFTNPEFIDELFDYTTRPRRSILEVLDEFASVRIPWQKVCSIIPLIRGRQFSIASGGALKCLPAPENNWSPDTKVELLIAIVKYRTVIKRIREGVCTRYISSLQPGQKITVTLQKGGLNPKATDIERPVVMIGPGTGVAPMRSLIYERMAWREAEGLGAPDKGNEDLLFFGCRSAESDYFFKDEWAELNKKGVLEISTAFSRDQVRYITLIIFTNTHSPNCSDKKSTSKIWYASSLVVSINLWPSVAAWFTSAVLRARCHRQSAKL